MMMQIRRSHLPIRIIAFMLLASLGLLTYLCAPRVLASPQLQTSPTAETEWATPLNLSRSGSASAPAIVIDEAGVEHVVWQEPAIESFVYSKKSVDWTPPIPVELPFGTRVYYPELSSDASTPLFTPELIADGAGTIHAFWIDDEQGLYHSSLGSADFAIMDSWSPRVLLAETAVQLGVTIDEGQTLHVAYALSGDSEEMPSGLYYLQSTDSGANWATPTLVHSSRYFRTFTAENLTLSLAAAGSGAQAHVFIAWDNRVLENVFLIRSTTGGESWDEVATVDVRAEEDLPEAAGPGNLRVALHNQQVHLLWQAGHETQTCALYHQWSSDEGSTWGPRQVLISAAQACPRYSQFVPHADGRLFAVAILEQEGSILAWDGQQWSTPQSDFRFIEFLDPETSRRITFQAREAVIDSQGQFEILGRDQSPNSDIWLLSRTLQDIETWFPTQSAWSEPTLVSRSVTAPQSPVLAGGAERNTYAFWIEPTIEDGGINSIFYADSVEEQWSRPAPVLTSPQSSTSQKPALIAGAGKRLFAVWQTDGGMLYFSQAHAESANIASEWSEPQQLPTLSSATRSPQIGIDPDQTIYVLYAVALNEGRGIYLITSSDLGTNWSEPRLIFDGVAAGWDMVDEPRLAIGASGTLHLLWTRFTLPPNARAQSVHYMRSVDAGVTWSEPELVDEGNILWSAMVASGDQLVQRLWQRDDDERQGFQFSTSANAGEGWTQVQAIPTLQSAEGIAAAAADSNGRVHFVLWTPGEVFYQWWNGSSWRAGDSRRLNTRDTILEAEDLATAATVSAGGHLSVIATGRLDNTDDDEPQFAVLSIGQILTSTTGVETPLTATPTDVPSNLNATVSPEPSLTAQPESAATSAPTLVPETAAADGPSPNSLLDASNPAIALIIGLLPVILLVVLVVIFVLSRRSSTGR